MIRALEWEDNLAWISSIDLIEGTGKLQPTEVVAKLKVFDTTDGSRIVQIDTHGSGDRENPGKQSQTLQLGRERAIELVAILKKTYGI